VGNELGLLLGEMLGGKLAEVIGKLLGVGDETTLGEALGVKLPPPSPHSQANILLYWHCRPISEAPHSVGGAALSRYVSNIELYT
jgi:hypothetical protein